MEKVGDYVVRPDADAQKALAASSNRSILGTNILVKATEPSSLGGQLPIALVDNLFLIQ